METKGNRPPRPELLLGTALSLCRKAQVGAFAAQAAFFVLLSAMPFLVFLTAILPYVPWEREGFSRWIPQELLELLPDLSPSVTVLSLSAVTALWSASRGIVALTRGLNSMYGRTETRSWLLLRFFALAETLILEIALLCTLGLAVRGEEAGRLLGLHGMGTLLQTGLGWALLTGVFLFFYTVLPDHSATLKSQLPGAMGAALGWLVFTRGYSFYSHRIADLSSIYGTLSNAAGLMLWLWLCLCIFFLGALINRLLTLL